MIAAEKVRGATQNESSYEDCYEIARRNFSPWPNARLIRGIVPDTLSTVSLEQVAYLSLDMNIAAPERAALEFFWPKLSAGAPVILDDYGWSAFAAQKAAIDEFARSKQVPVCCLPTGQGLIIKA